MFGFVSVQGMQILARVDFEHSEHNFLIAAIFYLSRCPDSMVAAFFSNLPTSLQMFFSNGIVAGDLIAIVHKHAHLKS